VTVTKMLNKLSVTTSASSRQVQTRLQTVVSQSGRLEPTESARPIVPAIPVILALILSLASTGWAQARSEDRQESEYYVVAYARHYQVPEEFVRAIVEQESDWHQCAVSKKGAVGLMQLMPGTAARLNVSNRCDVNQNVSGGVRYLAWLMNRFHGDLRLVAAAYYAGERAIDRRGLRYSNPDVVSYVASVRERFERQKKLRSVNSQHILRRTR
jgi:soluble lytic murein transglycosylase-like protein